MEEERARRLARAIITRDAAAKGLGRLLIGAGDAPEVSAAVSQSMRSLAESYVHSQRSIDEIVR